MRGLSIFSKLMIFGVFGGCASIGTDIGKFKATNPANLDIVIKEVRNQSDSYQNRADVLQDRIDNGYDANFFLTALTAASAISTMHASAVKGLAFLSGTTSVYSEQSPKQRRAEALLAAAKTLDCLVEKTHAAGYGNTARQPTRSKVADIARKVANLSANNQMKTTESTALATTIDAQTPTITDGQVARALVDGADFVERQLRQTLLERGKFDTKKIFSDLKALSELTQQRDAAAEAAASAAGLSPGSGKTVRDEIKVSDPGATILKELVVCRENLI